MRKPRRDGKKLVIPLYAIAATSALFGALGVGGGLVELNRANESLNWPSVKGKVASSRFRRPNGHTEHWTKVTVKYTYNIDGQSFQNTGRHKNRQTSERNFREKYSAGSDVDVFYDADNPASSVLEQGINPGSYSGLAVGFVLMILGVVFFAVHLVDSRYRSRNRAAGDG